MPDRVGILSLRDIKGVGLNPKDRHIMSDKLRSLFSNDWLDGLNDDQIYDLFEQYIELPGLSHIGYQKPPRPKPNVDGNVIDITPLIHDEWWLPKPEPEEEI